MNNKMENKIIDNKFSIQETFLQSCGQATTFSQIPKGICSQLKVSVCSISTSSSSLALGRGN